MLLQFLSIYTRNAAQLRDVRKRLTLPPGNDGLGSLFAHAEDPYEFL